MIASGLRMDTNLPDAVFNNAIQEGALFHAKALLGEKHFNEALSFEGALLNGGEVDDPKGETHFIAGLKTTLVYFAYVSLLRHNIVATSFGSVQKTDEYSTNVNPMEQIKYFETIARQFLREIAECKGWRLQTGGYFTTTAPVGKGATK